MTCDTGRLQAYMDGELAGAEREEMAEHLATCDACRDELATLQSSAQLVELRLSILDPLPSERPTPSLAYASFRANLATQSPTLWQSLTRRFRTMMNHQPLQRGAFRYAVVGLLALAILITMFTVAPAREAMAQFLSIFRVNNFRAVGITESVQEERLAVIQQLVDSGVLGEPDFLREPGEPSIVSTVAEAEAQAGYQVLAPTELPEGSTLSEISVVVGPHVRINVDRNTMELAMAMLGLENATLPSVDTITAEVDVPAIVHQRYDIENPFGERDALVSLVQAPAPDVEIPPGVDPTLLGELYLQAAGVPSEKAQRLAQAIDWTSTVVIPIPTDTGSYQEVEVNGIPGLLIRSKVDDQGYRRRTLLWERDGMVYAVEGKNLADSAMLQVAESIQ